MMLCLWIREKRKKESEGHGPLDRELRRELNRYRFDGCKRWEVMEKEKNCKRCLRVEMEFDKRN